MKRYRVAMNYKQLAKHNKNKGVTMYIDGRPKASRKITLFINSTWLVTTTKKPNYEFEGRKNILYLYVQQK